MSFNPPSTFIDIIYTNLLFEKYRNVYITNLSNGISYVYYEKNNQYIFKSKKALFIRIIMKEFGI